MTEEQAIERIKRAVDAISADYPYGGDPMSDKIAQAAWNEIKTIAREDRHLFGPVPAWRDDMTIEQAIAELLRGVRKQPVIPNDSGTGWL